MGEHGALGERGDDEAPLRRLLADRPDTLADAARSLAMSESEVESVITRLVDSDRLTWDGAHLGYPSPGIAATRRIRDRVERLQAAATEIDEELAELPWLIDDWAVGLAPGGEQAGILRFERLEDLAVIWRRRFAGRRTPRMCLMLPDVRVAALITSPEQTPEEYLQRTGMRVDVLLPSRDVDTPEKRGAARELMVPRTHYRAHPRAEHWFVVTTDTVVLRGADGFVLVQDLSFATLVRAYFDELWETSTDIEPNDRDAALLAALGDGQTVEAAAHTIGVSARTAHRRLAELMAATGTSSLFALGAAWGRQSIPRD